MRRKGEDVMDIECVGVVGAGTIGRGVAQSLAETGHTVLLLDVSDDKLSDAMASIDLNLRRLDMFRRKAPRQPPREVLRRIERSTDVEVLARAEVVIENVTEKWEVKRDLYRRLDGVCRVDTVF